MIEVGEYVRTRDGIIDKIKRLDCIILNKDITGEKHLYSYTDITKHSKNIIDLIEVGDYVNGFYVVKVGIIDEFKEKCVELFGAEKLRYNEEIKSIVTKEQFKNIEYRLED